MWSKTCWWPDLPLKQHWHWYNECLLLFTPSGLNLHTFCSASSSAWIHGRTPGNLDNGNFVQHLRTGQTNFNLWHLLSLPWVGWFARSALHWTHLPFEQRSFWAWILCSRRNNVYHFCVECDDTNKPEFEKYKVK